MNEKNILCSISTRGRYDTTLPLSINSVIQQTHKPDKLVIFDDNDNPVDLRQREMYAYLLRMLDEKGIQWEVIFGEKKGQHYNHQKANKMGYKWVWRLDDDTIAEPNTLKNLYAYARDDVGAVGGSVLTPPVQLTHTGNITGKIENINSEPNMQWYYIPSVRDVDHLHCTFLYRAGVFDYDLGLSRVAHREETLFTYGLKQRGLRLLVVPDAVTWHLRNSSGGIRDGAQEMYARDERIFELRDKTICILDSGMGDHIVFRKILPEIKNPEIFSCYPEIVPGKSIAEAKWLFGDDLNRFNPYVWMDQCNWKGPLIEAFRKFYVEGKR